MKIHHALSTEHLRLGLADMGPIAQELRRTLFATFPDRVGWTYIDIPVYYDPAAFRVILASMPQSGYLLLAGTSGTYRGAPWMRGQFLLSPSALECLRALAAQVHRQ